MTPKPIVSGRVVVDVPEHLVKRVDDALRAAGLIVQEYVKAGEFRHEVAVGRYDDTRAFVPKFLRYESDETLAG
jgi:hypothetical protein